MRPRKILKYSEKRTLYKTLRSSVKSRIRSSWRLIFFFLLLLMLGFLYNIIKKALDWL